MVRISLGDGRYLKWADFVIEEIDLVKVYSCLN